MSSLETVQSLQRKLLLLDLLSTARLSKSLPTFASQMEPKNIVHFFKCMDSNCDFTTNNNDLFLIHLSAHWEHSFLCTYCSEVICSDVQLVQHMMTEHSARIYQCALCFFRSRTKSHLIVHSMSIHKSRRIHGYLCSKVCDIPAKADTADSMSKSYACLSVPKCRTRCFSTERFLKHMREAHADAASYTCHKCRHEEGSPEGLVAHYEKVHNFMSYQCLYCSFGCDNEWPVMEHIAQDHADSPFKLLIRSSQPPDWFKELNALTRESKLNGLPNGIHSSQCSTDKSLSPPPSEIETKPPVIEEFKYSELEAMAGCSSALPTHFACQVENCSLVCSSAVSFISHVNKEHAAVTELSCPNCSALPRASARELFVHLIDNHTTLLRCPYSSCSFVGQQQEAVDAHIIAVHLQYETECSPQESDSDRCKQEPEEEEVTNPVSSSGIPGSLSCTVKAEPEEDVPQSTASSDKEIVPATSEEPSAPAEWLSDTELKNTAEEEDCKPAAKSYDDGNLSRNSSVNGSVNQAEFLNISGSGGQLADDAVEVYVCSLCCQSEMEALVYFRHMSLGHGVRYFCGHCEKGYKIPKQLLIHHSRFHDDKEMSFKTFQDNSLMNVPQKVISLWQRDIGAPRGKAKKVSAETTLKPPGKATHVGRELKSVREGGTSTRPESSEIKSDALSSEFCSEIKVAQKKKRGRRTENKDTEASGPVSEAGGSHASLGPSRKPIRNVPKRGKSPKQQSRDKTPMRSVEVNQKLETSDEAQRPTSPDSGMNAPREASMTPQNTPVQPRKQNSLQTPERGPKSTVKKPKSGASPLASGSKLGKTIKPTGKGQSGDSETSKETLEGKAADNSEEAKVRNSQNPFALCPNNLHVCVYCYKSYKVLKWAMHHQKAMHPDQPPMVKQLDFAKLDEIMKEGPSMVPPREQGEAHLNDDPQLSGSTSSKIVVPHRGEEVISLVDDSQCEPVKGKSDTESADSDTLLEGDTATRSQKNKRWRRITVISSDSSEDDEPLQQYVGFSYYGVEAEPMPTDDIFVYVQNGGVRLAYSQLASLLNLQPRVLVQKIEMP